MGMNKITATYMKINESILQDDTTFIYTYTPCWELWLFTVERPLSWA